MKIYYNSNDIQPVYINLIKSFLIEKLNLSYKYEMNISSKRICNRNITIGLIKESISANQNVIYVSFDIIYLIYYNTNIHKNNNLYDEKGRVLFDDYILGDKFPLIDLFFNEINNKFGSSIKSKKISRVSVDVDHLSYPNLSFLRFFKEYKDFHLDFYKHTEFLKFFVKPGMSFKYYLVMYASRFFYEKGLSADFFFMFGEEKTNFDSGYKISKDVSYLFNYLRDHGHRIGFHPSYYTFNSLDLWEKEYLKYISVIDNQPSIVRTHYLRTNYNFYYDILEKYNIREDHSIGSSNLIGNFCGITSGFSPINFNKDSFYSFSCYPLNYMDDYLFSNRDKFINLHDSLKSPFNVSMLFHNTSFLLTKNFNQIIKSITQ